jgi:transcriptional regulator with XRE-family HTH domain
MRRARDLRLSREALAERLGWRLEPNGRRSHSGWSPRTITRLELGGRGIRTPEELNQLAASLELTPQALEVRIREAASEPRTIEDPYGFAAAIDRVTDPDARALLLRVADDLGELARRLAADGGDAAGGPGPGGR